MKTLIERNQLSFFFLLTLVLSWYPWYAGIAPELIVFGPSLAAFITVFIVSGKSGLINFLRAFTRWRVGFTWWFVAIFGVAIIFTAGLGVHIILGGDAPPFIMIKNELGLIPLYLLIVFLPWNGPVGEEFGWRGFALPKLQNLHGPLVASFLIGMIWGIWHLPTFFAPVGVLAALTSSIGIGFIIPYTFTTIANSIFMTWLYNKTRRSALIAGIVWHGATDFWAPIMLSDSSLKAAEHGDRLPTIAPTLYLTVAFVFVVFAIILAITTKGQLGYIKSD